MTVRLCVPVRQNGVPKFLNEKQKSNITVNSCASKLNYKRNTYTRFIVLYLCENLVGFPHGTYDPVDNPFVKLFDSKRNSYFYSST